MFIQFVIPGRVRGKGRARSTIILPNKARDEAREKLLGSGALASDPSALFNAVWEAAKEAAFINEYTPTDTRSEEDRVRIFGKAAMAGRPPLDGPIWLSIKGVHTPPVSWPKSKREQTHYVTVKPDGSNIQKLIEDALNGVCWADDSKIAAHAFLKIYDMTAPEQFTVTFGRLEADKMPVPEWAPKALPLFEEAGR